MASIVTGVFPDAAQADIAVQHLRLAGFSDQDISLLTSKSTHDAFAVHTKSKVGEGAALGATIGGALAAVAVGLTAIGVVASGGLGLVATGPIVAALAGAGAGGAIGGLTGGLIGLGIPEHEAKYYEGVVAKGGILVGVRAEGDRKDVAKKIFADCKAESVTTA
ncbi:MAG: hypothetical protein JSS51_13865 [Planctomycetes bacterium]|nr:hypothetical protein [Planctomycetota bacterium]